MAAHFVMHTTKAELKCCRRTQSRDLCEINTGVVMPPRSSVFGGLRTEQVTVQRPGYTCTMFGARERKNGRMERTDKGPDGKCLG